MFLVASRVARWTIAPPASLPAELPHRTTYPTNSLLTAARRREWRVDEQSSNADPITSARGRDPVRPGGSRARTPGSRVRHRAQGVGGRMPPMLRNPLRPGGPRKTDRTHIRNTTKAAGRMPASNCNVRPPGSSRRTRRRHANLNANTVTSARRHDHFRTEGSRARMPGCVVRRALAKRAGYLRLKPAL